MTQPKYKVEIEAQTGSTLYTDDVGAKHKENVWWSALKLGIDNFFNSNGMDLYRRETGVERKICYMFDKGQSGFYGIGIVISTREDILTEFSKTVYMDIELRSDAKPLDDLVSDILLISPLLKIKEQVPAQVIEE